MTAGWKRWGPLTLLERISDALRRMEGKARDLDEDFPLTMKAPSWPPAAGFRHLAERGYDPAGRRFTNAWVDRNFIEDAYVYRAR